MDGSRDTLESVPRVAARVDESELVARTVERLKAMKKRTGLSATLAIGELILNEFFGGDPSAWQDRRRNKNNSIRRLAGRPDCPFSRSSLDLAVTVYVETRGMPCAQTFGHIGASHIALVLGLPESEREAMLEGAEREKLSVRELRQKVVSLRREGGEKRGRPPLENSEKALALLRNAVLSVRQAVELLTEGGELQGDVRAECVDLADELGGWCADISGAARPSRSVVRVAVVTDEGRGVMARETG
jgi:hypothetical protein